MARIYYRPRTAAVFKSSGASHGRHFAMERRWSHGSHLSSQLFDGMWDDVYKVYE